MDQAISVLPGLPNGSYIVAPSQSGYTFSPTTASVTINSASVTGVNFTSTAVTTTIPHSVVLSWKASTSTNLKGYNVYRASVAGGAFTKLTASPMATTAYADSTVASGRTYYYVTTAVNRITPRAAIRIKRPPWSRHRNAP